ncbi:hypothetical protein KRP22_010984 [Phytophthora ramorum]|nr:hypothetical protein KRP22_5144 [Phytophthora ramorum]
MEDVVAQINARRPEYVLITSKSGAGKTYSSTHLEEYTVLELDEGVTSVGNAFGMEQHSAFQVYKNTLSEAVTAALVERIHDFFEQHRGSEIAVEGAIAYAELVKRVLGERFKQDKEHNTRTLAVWPQVTPEIEAASDDSPQLEEFMVKMARWSIARSAQRYHHFEQNGLDMIRVEV